MWKWKLLFALIAVFGPVYGSSNVNTLPSIDIVVTFRIDDSQKVAEGIMHLMDKLAIRPSSELQIGVCCVWWKGSFRLEIPWPSGAEGGTISERLRKFLLTPLSTGRICGRRDFTHYGDVLVKTVARKGRSWNQWMTNVSLQAEEEAKNITALAIVFLDDYHLEIMDVNPGIWQVVQFSDPIIRRTNRARSWPAAAEFVVGAIWNESISIFRECKYSATNESCYFSREQRDQCLREERVEPFRKEQWSPAAQKSCYGVAFVKNVSCKLLSDCDDSCSVILENVPCPCGGIWNKTVPNRFKYCRITSTICVGKPCPLKSSLSVGAVLMITGSVMFVSSGIGLIIFWFVCVKKGKMAAGGKKSKFNRRR